MRASALLDTGAILAMMNREDRWHESCIQCFTQLHKPVLTSEAVLTESFHLLGDHRRWVEAAWDLLCSGAIMLGGIKENELPEIAQLMHRYQDRPMDFADATLVYLAQKESLNTILTVDISDFETYRIDGRKVFRILPGRSGRR